MRLIRPRPVALADTIGIVSVSAPESIANKEFFDRGIEAIRSAGYEIIIAPHVERKRGYVSAAASEVAADLMGFFKDPKIGCIICAGGGINANRLTHFLDFDVIADNPKPIVGVSNPTVLLNAITTRTGLITFHGPSVVWDFGSDKGMPSITSKSFWKSISTKEASISIQAEDSWVWLRPGNFVGRLVGGNLTSVQALLGTVNEPSWQGSVLFWEDIAKPVNRLDMMLTHFRDAGVFDRLSGMIVGQLVSCDPSEGVTYQEMLLDLLADYSFPILTEVPFGHTAEKLTLPIGAISEVSVEGMTFYLNERS